ncbi:DNA-binding response regulator in two-component regulatory system with PhoQ [Vibrio coralliirubri]|nr:response regulator transcription factor [Vibrio coralliirubri]CDT91073.1 DNA-binding response regulator in two-component regulatory system with PhoQ [Vibrio coralliirubri]
MNILVVEDNKQLLNELAMQLTHQDMSVHQAETGIEGDYCLKNFQVDLVILDLGLPDQDGLVWLKMWREEGIKVPVIILTARDNWTEKVEGLTAGADDYLAKPFIFEELLARSNALYRRSYGVAKSSVDVGLFNLNIESKKITVNSIALDLSAYEYRLLKCLILNAGKIVSKDRLRADVYGDELVEDGNVIAVLLSRIRKKILANEIKDPIITIRNQGYKFCEKN